MARLGSALLESDPPFRALYVWSCNPAVIVPEQEKVVAGLSREDLFVVVHEQVMTDTARYADILLPNTTCFEHDDYFTPCWHLYASHSPAAIAPVGESKSDYEVFRLLAESMGFAEPCFRRSGRYRRPGHNPLQFILHGVSAERLKREGMVRLNVPGHPHLAFADGRFPTPSGKIELYSETMEAVDSIRPPLTNRPWRVARRPTPQGRYPLQMVTLPNHHFLNSSFAEVRA